MTSQLDAVQQSVFEIRAQAYALGILSDTDLQKVVRRDNLVLIVPTQKDKVAIPKYDPVALLGAITPIEPEAVQTDPVIAAPAAAALESVPAAAAPAPAASAPPPASSGTTSYTEPPAAALAYAPAAYAAPVHAAPHQRWPTASHRARSGPTQRCLPAVPSPAA